MSVQYQDQNQPMMSRPEGKETIGASSAPFNQLETSALQNLDEDKLNELAESLFVLNNRRYGPIPGAYMVVCTKENQEWCVGQLNADRLKPIIMYEDKVFSSPERAQEEAENLKISRGETTPCRCT